MLVAQRDGSFLLTRYCNFCGIEIADQKRAKRSPYCTNEHKRMAVNEKRALRALGDCRLCGRKSRKPKTAAAKSASA